MNLKLEPDGQESALETLKKQALAIVIIPPWTDDDMHSANTERTRMLLCTLVHTLEMYFKDTVISPVANYCTIAHESGERAMVTRDVINDTVSISPRADTNQEINMSAWPSISPEGIASVFLKLLGNHFRFLFLVADGSRSTILAVRRILPYLPDRMNYSGRAGEGFIYFPGAALFSSIKLPGVQD